MKNEINAVLENMTTATPEPEDYTGEDGLLYCGRCRKPKEAYFAPDKAAIFGRDRHPAECDCQRAAREEREAAEKRRRHLDTVEELKRRGFTDPAMRDWTFENDNGRNPQAGLARRYVEHWEDMRTDNIGCLFWGGVGTGKSYLAGCSLAVALCRVAVKPKQCLALREVGFFGLVTLAAVQQAVFAGVVLRLRRSGRYGVNRCFQLVLHKLSPSLHE